MTEEHLDAFAAKLAPVLLELIANGSARTDPPAAPASPDSLAKSVAKEPVAKKAAAKKAASRKPAAKKPSVK